MSYQSNGLIDLHVHSVFSDGSETPLELLARAQRSCLRAIAITDHDDLRAHQHDMSPAITGVELVTGIELSTVDAQGQEIHVLGYLFDAHNRMLQDKLHSFRESRVRRAASIVATINQIISDRDPPQILAFEQVRKLTHGSFGRPHIAEALLQAGIVGSKEQAFEEFLVPLNMPKQYFPIAEAIALLRDTEAVPVLAHPARLLTTSDYLRSLLTTLVPAGLRGIEVYTSSSKPEEELQLLRLANDFGLVATGGSDYHSPDGYRTMGLPLVTHEVLERLHQVHRAAGRQSGAL